MPKVTKLVSNKPKMQTQDANPNDRLNSALCYILQPLTANRFLKPKATTYGLKSVCRMITAQNRLEAMYFYFI